MLTGTGLEGWKTLQNISSDFLYEKVRSINTLVPSKDAFDPNMASKLMFINEDSRVGIHPFYVDKGEGDTVPDEQFTFCEHKTKYNLMRLLRGLQLKRPILLEGSPGVGKTSLVVALAKASNNQIVRINLSEQTDVSDLFGADLPVEGEKGGVFAWRDGPLLQALKRGSWVVFDELNLASQSVLEALNACFDHRGEIYLPELGKTFKVSHKVTKIFACQNPQYQGGARKGLPRSFLNRFTQVHIEPIETKGLKFIIQNKYGEDISMVDIENMVAFTNKLVESYERSEFGAAGGPWEFNLRDLFRWCELKLDAPFPSHRQCVELIYVSRMRKQSDKDFVRQSFQNIFTGVSDHEIVSPNLSWTSTEVIIGNVHLPLGSCSEDRDYNLSILPHQLEFLQKIALCISRQWLVLLVGASGAGKTATLSLFSQLCSQKLETLTLSPQMDVGELLGCYEQVDYNSYLTNMIIETEQLVKITKRMRVSDKNDQQQMNGVDKATPIRNSFALLSIEKKCETISDSMSCLLAKRSKQALSERSKSDELKDFLEQCDSLENILKQLNMCGSEKQSEDLFDRLLKLQKTVTEAKSLSSSGIFEWKDSSLLRAIKNGTWVAVEGASNCPPSVLDRLNSLFEPSGELLLTERGGVNGSILTVKAHASFRMFLVIDHTSGEVSRAMRNRGVELFFTPIFSCPESEKSNDASDDSKQDKCIKSSKKCVESFETCDDSPPLNILKDYISTLPSNPNVSFCHDFVGILASTGVTDPLTMNMLALVHLRVCSVLPHWLEPSVSVMAQSAQTVRQLHITGESIEVALEKAIQRHYVKSFTSADVRVTVSREIDQVFRQFDASKSKVALPDLSSIIIQTRNHAKNGSLVQSVQQMEAYLRCVLSNNAVDKSKREQMFKAPLPFIENLPVFDHKTAIEVIILVFASLPFSGWSLFKQCFQLNRVPSQNNYRLEKLILDMITNLESNKDTIQAIESVFKADQCAPADSRFISNCEKTNDLEVQTKIGNQILLAIRIHLNKLVMKKESKANKIKDSLMAFSKDLKRKTMDITSEIHEGVSLLHPLIFSIDKFLMDIVTVNNNDVELTNDCCMDMIEMIDWRYRLEEICSKPKGMQSFNKSLPTIILHVKKLEEHLGQLKCFKSIFEKFNKVFSSKCGRIHDVAKEMTSVMVHADPYTTHESAEVNIKLLEIEKSLYPDLTDVAKNVVIAEDGVSIKTNLSIMKCNYNGGQLSAIESLESLNLIEEKVSDSKTSAEASNPLTLQANNMKVQTWPLIDYVTFTLAAKLLFHGDSNSDDLLQGFLSLCSFSPSFSISTLELDNKDIASLHECISDFASNATFSCNTKKWTQYENQKRSRINSKVSSPVQCLLNYLLCAGWSDKTRNKLEIGSYRVKAKQLHSITEILWKFMPILSNPTISHKIMFNECAKRFSSNLFGNFKKLLYGEAAVQSDELMSGISSYLGDRCGLDCTNLFEKYVIPHRSVLETSQVVSIKKTALMSAACGLIQGWVGGHLPVMDPALETKVIINILKDRVHTLEQILRQHSWNFIMKGGKPMAERVNESDEITIFSNDHPHLEQSLTSMLRTKEEIKQLSLDAAYRPDENEYSELVNNVDAFCSNAFNPSALCKIFEYLSSDDALSTELNPSSIDGKLITFDNFLKKIKHQYPLFRDVTSVFTQGLSMTIFSIRVLNALKKMHSTETDNKLSSLLIPVVSCPVERNPAKPLQTFHNLDNVGHIVNICYQVHASSDQKAEQKNNVLCKKVQRKALKVKFFELHSDAGITGKLSTVYFTILVKLMSEIIEWWREQENEKKKRKEAKANFFKYREKVHAENCTEDEELQKDFAKVFPSYHKQFDDLNEDHLNENTLEEVPDTEQIESDLQDFVSNKEFLELIEFSTNIFSNTGCISISGLSPVSGSYERNEILRSVCNDIGPLADCDLDRSTIGAHILSLHAASKSWSDSTSSTNILKKPKNFYIDPRPEEADKIPGLLIPLLERIDGLLEEFPENPSLDVVKKIVERVLKLSITAPMGKLVSSLESVLIKTQIWEENAHRGVSLGGELTAETEEANLLYRIKRQIVIWREMELKEWKDFLDLVNHKEVTKCKVKWWPYLFETLNRNEWDEVSIALLIKVLKDFMFSSTLGDYECRLKLLESYYYFLIRARKETGDISVVLLNVFKYFNHFLPYVHSALETEKKEIDSVFKETIKIANYSIAKYRDINQVRLKIEKCCQTLHMQMAKWKKVLVRKDGSYMMDTGEDLQEQSKGLWDAKEPEGDGSCPVIRAPEVVNTSHFLKANVDEQLQTLGEHSKRARVLATKIIDELPYSRCSEDLESTSASIIECYRESNRKTSLANCEPDKDKKKSKLKDALHFKRNQFNRYCQQFKEMGLKYRVGINKWSDSKFDECFLITTFNIESLNLVGEISNILPKLFAGCDKYFYRCLNRNDLLLRAMATPHADLKLDHIERVRGISSCMMLKLMKMRDIMYGFVRNISHLQSYVGDFISVSSDKISNSLCLASNNAVVDQWKTIRSFSSSLIMTSKEVMALIDTKLDKTVDSSDNDLVDNSLMRTFADIHSFDNQSLLEVKDSLAKVVDSASKQVYESASQLERLSDLDCSKVIVMNDIKNLEKCVNDMGDLSSQLARVLDLVDPNRDGHVCLSGEFIKWHKMWSATSASITEFIHSCKIANFGAGSHDLTAAEKCISLVKIAIQCLYKKHCDGSRNSDTDTLPPPAHNTNDVIDMMLEDVKKMCLDEVLACLRTITEQLSDKEKDEKLSSYVSQLSPLLQQYCVLSENLLLGLAANNRSFSKLQSVVSAICYQMALKGFCKPQETEEDGEGGDGQGKMSIEDDNDDACGLQDGKGGNKDISDQLESEDQLDSNLKEGEKEKEADEDVEEDDGIEMSNDFEGELQDKDKNDGDNDEPEDDDGDNAHDQMGQTEEGAETIDDKLWNDKEDKKDGDESQELEEDDKAAPADAEGESQMVDKGSNKDDKDKKDDKQQEDAQEKKDDPETMEEDLRKPNKPTEENEEFNEDFKDELAGEDKKNDEELGDKDDLDIADDAQFDEDMDGDDNQDENAPDSHEIEKHGLFPEEKEDESDKNQDENAEKQDDQMEEESPEVDNEKDAEEENDENPDDSQKADEDFNTDNVVDEKDEEVNKNKKNAGVDESNIENDGVDADENEDKLDPAKDKDTDNQACAAPIDSNDASKDKTKDAPSTENEGGIQDELDLQEDCGKDGEKTRESLAVGQADSDPMKDQEMHQTSDSAISKPEKGDGQEDKMKQNKKPGELDEERKTGSQEKKDLKTGLMTNRKNLEKNEDESMKDNNDNEDGEEQPDSDKYQVIKKGEKHVDQEMVDAGTRDQAIEAPAPVQDDTADAPEEEGVVDNVMDVDDKKPENEEAPTVEAEDILNGPKQEKSKHKMGQQSGEPKEEDEVEDMEIETEGEFIAEQTVERAPESYFHTLIEEDELTAQVEMEDNMHEIEANLLASADRMKKHDKVAVESWAQHQATTATHASMLSDQLRLILEPTQASRLKGDYKSGKRLNMKKVIPYIASHFVKDKIWLRRTHPSKRTYHVMLAIDDSESMKEVKAEELAKQSISLLSQALTKLEVGKIGVMSFGSQTTLLHRLDENFNDIVGADIFANLTFEQKESRFAEMLESSLANFKHARGGVSNTSTEQILIVVSDGQVPVSLSGKDKRAERIRAAVRAARNDNILIVFIVLDADKKCSFYDRLFWDPDSMQLTPVADKFPFPYHLVVRDLSTLPQVMAEALRNWFELINSSTMQ